MRWLRRYVVGRRLYETSRIVRHRRNDQFCCWPFEARRREAKCRKPWWDCCSTSITGCVLIQGIVQHEGKARKPRRTQGHSKALIIVVLNEVTRNNQRTDSRESAEWNCICFTWRGSGRPTRRVDVYTRAFSWKHVSCFFWVRWTIVIMRASQDLPRYSRGLRLPILLTNYIKGSCTWGNSWLYIALFAIVILDIINPADGNLYLLNHIITARTT